MKPITYNKQYLNNADKNAVKNVINQKFLTNGNNVKKFEKKLKKFFDVKYCTTFNIFSLSEMM